MIDPFALRALLEGPEGIHKYVTNLIAEHYLPISAMAWDRYWQEGVPPIDDDAFGVFSQAAVTAPAYSSYITTERNSHFLMQAFLPLIEIYEGRASPGLPALSAPKNWRWVWVGGEQPKVCLAGINLHTSTWLSTGGVAENYCIDYYDEAAASSLIRK